MTFMEQHRMLSLYRKASELKKALMVTIGILYKNEHNLNHDEEGFYSIDEVCHKLKEVEPELDYINRNHIIELYFKDPYRKLIISDLDKIKYRQVKYVCPPSILYFGTTESLSVRIKEQGLRSKTKGYIKLYGNAEKAMEVASKYPKYTVGEKVIILAVDSKKAYQSGLRFSVYIPDEYIVPEVKAQYLLDIVL